MIAIINYGVGNLTSVLNMFKRIGADAIITNDKQAIQSAERILIPGVGNFDSCMQRFNESGLREMVEKKAHEEKVPVLGICVGAQMITMGSEEGSEKGLGWVSADTIRFRLEDQPQFKIPNMGWNEMTLSRPSPLWNDLPDEPRFYFAHSYHFSFDDDSLVTGKANYGYEYPVAFKSENIFGTQFHPEKKPEIWDESIREFFKNGLMRRVRIIPVLLLKKGGLYKTIKFKNANYVGDPINTVKIFNEKEADELVLLDFNASLEKRGIDFKKITEIAGEAFMPLSYGGGVKSLEDARKIFDAGYEKIILNSVLFQNLGIINEIGNIYGAQAVVGSIDVKKNIFGKNKVYSHSGTSSTGHDPVEWANVLEQNGVGEILINSIDRDGTWSGYDETLVEKISNAVAVPVIACGGAGGTNDFKIAVKAGASAVAAGSMFVYQKKGMGVLISFPSEKIVK